MVLLNHSDPPDLVVRRSCLVGPVRSTKLSGWRYQSDRFIRLKAKSSVRLDRSARLVDQVGPTNMLIRPSRPLRSRMVDPYDIQSMLTQSTHASYRRKEPSCRSHQHKGASCSPCTHDVMTPICIDEGASTCVLEL